MINTNFKSINSILERISRNTITNGITPADVAQDVADCMVLIGAPTGYEEKLWQGEVVDNRAELPCDLLYIIQTRRRLKIDETVSNAQTGDSIVPMRYASDTFHSAYHEAGSPDFNLNSDNTYTISSGKVYTSFDSGNIEMMYKALQVDDDGLPMIPDDPSFENAIYYHVLWKHYEVLWTQQKISDKVFEYTQQQRDWYVAQANTKAGMLSIDQSETFRASLSRMIYDENQAKSSFVNSGTKENFNYNGYTNRGGSLGSSTYVASADLD